MLRRRPPDSPAVRDANPTVVLIPGIGMFTFGKTKTESRITGEFYVNAIHVMEGASALSGKTVPDPLPQAGPAAPTTAFQVHSNYVALPISEAFRIEYWKLEEAKIRRQPPEKQLSRQIALIVGGGSGIGREVAALAAQRGAHVVVADRDFAAANAVALEAQAIAGKEPSTAVAIDIRNRETIQEALKKTVTQFGGLDILVNTAAIFPASPDGIITDAQWALTLDVNVTANYLLTDEAAKLFRDQGLNVSVVLTSSANAVVAKRGSEAYDVSKAAVSHLVRELAISLLPRSGQRNQPCHCCERLHDVSAGSRHCFAHQYEIPFSASATDEGLRGLLAEFYATKDAHASAHRPQRLCGGDPLSRRSSLPLHNRTPDSCRRRSDRSVS